VCPTNSMFSRPGRRTSMLTGRVGSRAVVLFVGPISVPFIQQYWGTVRGPCFRHLGVNPGAGDTAVSCLHMREGIVVRRACAGYLWQPPFTSLHCTSRVTRPSRVCCTRLRRAIGNGVPGWPVSTTGPVRSGFQPRTRWYRDAPSRQGRRSRGRGLYRGLGPSRSLPPTIQPPLW
jgi:hypothetical protein